VWTLVAIALVASAGSQPVRLQGTVTLAAVNSAKHCKFSGGATVLTAFCRQSGAFTGKPGAADAAYSWRWDLELGKDGNTTGNATEVGNLALDFGGLGVLRVTTRGRLGARRHTDQERGAGQDDRPLGVQVRHEELRRPPRLRDVRLRDVQDGPDDLPGGAAHSHGLAAVDRP
jgi:hypothetical protein